MASGSAGPDDAGSILNRSASVATIPTCSDCGRLFDSVRNLSQHRRLVHTSGYYDAVVKQVKVSKKSRWDHEEMVLMAREELRLIKRGVSNMNQELTKVMSGRTLEAIRGRRRALDYKQLVEKLGNHRDDSEGDTGSDVTQRRDNSIVSSPLLFSDDEVLETSGVGSRERLLNVLNDEGVLVPRR